MPWAICDWCERVQGVMWYDKSETVQCERCDAWLSVDRFEKINHEENGDIDGYS